jgi:OmpA-OmpF porin, OOP family
MKLLYHILFGFALLGQVAVAHAQSSTDDVFTPREMVIFSDDFSQDPVGAFPEQWEMVPCDSAKVRFDSKTIKVRQDSGKHFLEMKTVRFHMMPKIRLASSISDSFTVECDVFFATTFGSSEIALIPGPHRYNCGNYFCCYPYRFYIMQWGELRTYMGADSSKMTSVDFPGTIDTTSWHHLGISYNRGEVKVYVDSFIMFAIPRCGFVPTNILFGGWATVKYRNIRIATGPQATPIRQLLKGKPLTTHAILFDVGSAAIKPESNKYLEELASLLLANPKLKLNINGHTDSDGSDAENLLLSEKRAMAVKDFLTLKGITESRLTTKGFGESKPLKRGFTADIKALNRRVEFVPR